MFGYTSKNSEAVRHIIYQVQKKPTYTCSMDRLGITGDTRTEEKEELLSHMFSEMLDHSILRKYY